MPGDGFSHPSDQNRILGTVPIELLAPARNLECGIAAVNCGADAVYIGPERFGAREAAGNSLSDIERLVRHAHKYWAKVYAALNTILRDEELPEAVRLAQNLHGIGIDGLIIQDMGLLECGLPPIPLIASTQMHNDTPEKVAFLEAVGFKRAILARELSLDDVRAVRRSAASIELESFVHGALCVCFSGQCYMSYALGGRSGNRGACAQPCRRVYRLADDRARDLGERHWLSLKDMNRSGRLKDLGDAGVTAFKIEGRLKNRDYVMNVTRHYRRELDGILDGSVFRRASSGVLVNDFIPDLEKTFNREYTEFFLDGRSGPVGRTQTPKFVGEPLGKASSVSRDRFTLNARVSLAPGDGLTFFDASGALQGTVVNRVQGSTIFPERMAGIERGTPIYRNMDHRFSQSLLKREVTRKIRIRMDLRDTRHGLLLSVEDEDGTHVTRMLESGFSPAKKSEQALDTIRKQLTSLGGTVFACEALEIRTDPIPFAPVSAWNRLRREILELLDRLREEKRPRESRFAVSNNVRYPTDSLSYQGNVLNRKAEAFYRRHGVQRIEPAAEKGLDMSGKKVMTTRYCLQYELGRCRGSRASGVLHDSWILVDRDGKKFRLDFDCANCRMEIVYSGE